ncbi:MAG: YoaK family protein [Bacteroidota bacterium]|nr:YoaK family protein [Bacteroidota bacterium]
MFRHKGNNRTFIHNLRLASLLSLVAGIVNITGVLSVKVLTTNVTGHFAFFGEEFSQKNYVIAIVYLVFILSFLAGAFFSNMLIEILSRKRPVLAYAVPMFFEILLLTCTGFFGKEYVYTDFSGQVVACVLLFSMGLQNSLVTKVSQSVVRTTHLTGLFTDLGIELSQLFFYRKKLEFHQLSRSIFLKLAIIGCFFSGCVIGGLAYRSLGLKTLLVASVVLLFALFYDNIRLHYYNLKRKIQAR